MHKEIQVVTWKYLASEFVVANDDDLPALERVAERLERQGYIVQIELMSKDGISFFGLTGEKSLVTDAAEV